MVSEVKVLGFESKAHCLLNVIFGQTLSPY